MTVVVLKQRDLLTKRWKRVDRIDPSEVALHIAVVNFFRQRLRPDVVFFHSPNGELRDKRTAAKLRAMGVLPGVADLVFIWGRPGYTDAPICEVLFLELKRKGKHLSEAQRLFADRARRAGAHYAWADDFEAAVASVDCFGLITAAP